MNTEIQNISNADLLKLRAHLISGGSASIEQVRANGGGQFSTDDLSLAMTLSKSVAKVASDDEWISFMRDQKLPDVATLSPREMEALRGGNGAILLMAVAYYGAILFGLMTS